MTSANLGQDVLLQYRNNFKAAVARGERMPLTVPYTLSCTLILPVIWLSIPHRNRPWLYQTRWLLMAIIVSFSLHVIHVTSSTNPAIAYATGLLAGWACIMNANVLFWTRPQWDAARVMRRKKSSTKGVANANNTEESIRHGNGHATTSTASATTTTSTKDGQTVRQRVPKESAKAIQGPLEDEESEYESYWQPFPEDGTFLERFLWAGDFAASFRGNGWNSCVSSIPHPNPPNDVSKEELVDLSSIPKITPAGYRFPASESELVRSRLTTLAYMYVVLDFLSVFVVKDPYFVLGPERPDLPHPPLPSHLRGLGPWQLLFYRQIMSLTAFVSAIISLLKLNDLLQYSLGKLLWPTKVYVWQYASAYGSPTRILDCGLGGFWGSWWHQTFRLQFMGPASYLFKKGLMKRGSTAGRIITMFCSFLQSGLLHMPGGITSMPETQPWNALMFFLLQTAGVVVQRELSGWLAHTLPQALLHRRICQAANFAFAFVFLFFTAPLFCDEIAMAGLWMLEPVPFSPLRFLGYGLPGDTAWRWDKDFFPGWYTGKRWWQSGIGF